MLTMLLWGSLFPVIKLGFAVYKVSSIADILLFAGIRFVICGAVICAIAALNEKKEAYKNTGKCIFPILLSGFFAVVLHYSLSYAGLELSASSKTALIKQVGALFYVCFSFVFMKEDKSTPRKILAAVIGFLGIVALNTGSDGISFSVGDVLILASSFCMVASSVISKRIYDRVSPISATGISQLFGGAVLLIVGFAAGGTVRFALDRSVWIMVYICFASTVSYCLWNTVLKSGELSKLFIIKFAEPVFACLFGALILNENIWKLQYLLAFVLIFGGIWISHVQKHTKKE